VRRKKQKKAVEAAADEEDGVEEWTLAKRHFVQPDSHSRVTCCASNRKNMILFGFSDGIFSLYELPSGQKLQSLSASKFALESAAITADGAWLALASPTMGQLLVWEWFVFCVN
jgi:periodic tryptophan protein 2